MQRFYADLMWVGGTVAAGLLGWALVRHGAVPNERAAVELALRHIALADLERITVYPLLPAAGERAEAGRPYGRGRGSGSGWECGRRDGRGRAVDGGVDSGEAG